MSEAKTQIRKSRKSKAKTQSKKPQTLAELFLTPGYKYPTNKSRRLKKIKRRTKRGGAKKRKTNKKRKTYKKRKTHKKRKTNKKRKTKK